MDPCQPKDWASAHRVVGNRSSRRVVEQEIGVGPAAQDRGIVSQISGQSGMRRNGRARKGTLVEGSFGDAAAEIAGLIVAIDSYLGRRLWDDGAVGDLNRIGGAIQIGGRLTVVVEHQCNMMPGAHREGGGAGGSEPSNVVIEYDQLLPGLVPGAMAIADAEPGIGITHVEDGAVGVRAGQVHPALQRNVGGRRVARPWNLNLTG